LEIGDHTLIASRVFITDTSYGNYEGENSSSPQKPPNSRELFYKAVKIGKSVLIGENVSILSGVEIGNGCVIGANSVVTKSVGENCIVVGAPVVVIKNMILTKKVGRVETINNMQYL